MSLKILKTVEESFWGLEMNYNTIFFLFFIGAFLLVYAFMKTARARQVVILTGNLVFYLWNGYIAFLIVLLTGLITYVISRRIEYVYQGYEEIKDNYPPKEQPRIFTRYKKKAKIWLCIAFLFIIGTWIFVKTGKVIGLEGISDIRELEIGKCIIVPLGISYYTLSSVGYLLDVFWRKAEAEHNFRKLFTVMTYFPHNVQGPIGRYDDLLEKIEKVSAIEYNRLCFGLQRMLWGYIKKLVVADRIALFTTTVFTRPWDYAGTEIIVAVVFCGVQLYADFSGCMDIVIGLSQIIGIQLKENFNQPFLSKSASEFWTRWHITLSAWTKDYIYLPIAMNGKHMKFIRTLNKKYGKRVGTFVKFFTPLVAVWLFTGLWHGTGWDYILWGLYWCLMMTLSFLTENTRKSLREKLHIDSTRKYFKIFECVRTYLIFVIGRMWTVCGGDSFILWKQIFKDHRLWTLFDDSLYTIGWTRKDCWLVLIFIVIMLFVDICHESGVNIRQKIALQPLVIRWAIYYLAIIALVIFGMYGPGYDAASFVYGAF